MSELIDKPDYEKLCAEKQRRIDALEGQLEQKNGWLRNIFVKAMSVVAWPFRKPVEKMKAFTCHPATIACAVLSAIVFGVWHFGEFEPFFRARRGPELTLRQMAEYDGYSVKKVESKFVLVDPRESVAQLTSPDGSMNVYVRVPPDVWRKLGSCDRVDVVELEPLYKQVEIRRRERKAILDRIRNSDILNEWPTNK